MSKASKQSVPLVPVPDMKSTVSLVGGVLYQLLPQNTTTSKREARRWWMNAGVLNVDRNVSFCAIICSKEGLLIVSKTLAQREG